LVTPEQEGTYFTLPFDMPPDTETFHLAYSYARHVDGKRGPDGYTSRTETSIIDLGLIGPDGEQVGASGSDKTEIMVSETSATPGYRPTPLAAGRWEILVGAYKVAPGGVEVRYELTFTPKRLRLFKGDLHAHTLASDGVLSLPELGAHARRHGLDFLAITDHNQMISAQALPHISGLTLIPGVEWTHFRGHATFLGVDRPYEGSFHANTPEEVRARFESARARGALIVISHPCDEAVPFQFDLGDLPYDCLEVWNGPMRVSNLQAIGMWQGMLAAGRPVPICGGSDYHRSQLFLFLGGPTTCIYARSPGRSDLLAGLRAGHAFITFAPDGPGLQMQAGEAIMGDSLPFDQERTLHIEATGLQAGDLLQVVTASGSTPLLEVKSTGSFQGEYTMDAPGFARVEILRNFIPGIPLLPALISNPIYFTA
jgi:hypothetical protein